MEGCKAEHEQCLRGKLILRIILWYGLASCQMCLTTDFFSRFQSCSLPWIAGAGLAVVRVRRLVVRLLRLADLRRGLHLLLEARDGLVDRRDLVRQLSHLRRERPSNRKSVILGPSLPFRAIH